MPTPASASPAAASSPVPAYSVLCAASYVRAPIAPEANAPSDTLTQPPLPERALSVRQTPPPAAPTHSVHCCAVQLGEIASAVMRPEVTYWLPCRFRNAG